MKPLGRCLVSFDSSIMAIRFIDVVRGRAGPGAPFQTLEAQLVDVKRPPFPLILSDRLPLSLKREILIPQDYPNSVPVLGRPLSSTDLSASTEWSGRAVLLKGFPRRMPHIHILENTRKEGFQVLRAPSTAKEGGKLEDIVRMPGLVHGFQAMSSGC